MKGLTFRAQWVGPIVAGTKTSTIRRPRAGLPVAGDTIRLVCRYDLPPFAHALVTSTADVLASELTEEDARADGFECLADLLALLDAWGTDGPDSPLVHVPLTWRVIKFTLAKLP